MKKAWWTSREAIGAFILLGLVFAGWAFFGRQVVNALALIGLVAGIFGWLLLSLFSRGDSE